MMNYNKIIKSIAKSITKGLVEGLEEVSSSPIKQGVEMPIYRPPVVAPTPEHITASTQPIPNTCVYSNPMPEIHWTEATVEEAIIGLFMIDRPFIEYAKHSDGSVSIAAPHPFNDTCGWHHKDKNVIIFVKDNDMDIYIQQKIGSTVIHWYVNITYSQNNSQITHISFYCDKKWVARNNEAIPRDIAMLVSKCENIMMNTQCARRMTYEQRRDIHNLIDDSPYRNRENFVNNSIIDAKNGNGDTWLQYAVISHDTLPTVEKHRCFTYPIPTVSDPGESGILTPPYINNVKVYPDINWGSTNWTPEGVVYNGPNTTDLITNEEANKASEVADKTTPPSEPAKVSKPKSRSNKDIKSE